MLTLQDFLHLPQLIPAVDEMVADRQGLMVIAGLDPRPEAAGDPQAFLPSGRATIFRILMRQLMDTREGKTAVVAESKESIRLPRRLRQQVVFFPVSAQAGYAQQVAKAVSQEPDLLVVDTLHEGNIGPVLESTRSGPPAISQLDTVFRGTDVARALAELGATSAQLQSLRWVMAVQRMATLCPHCKQPHAPLEQEQAALKRRYPALSLPEGSYYEPSGCTRCHQSGRLGDVFLFDIYRHAPEGKRLLSLEAYMLHLAAAGHLPLSDLLQLDAEQLQRTYHLLTGSEQALSRINAALESKLAELAAAHHLLQQRTEALLSLQKVGQALAGGSELRDLAHQICRYSCELCGGERAILYFQRGGVTAQVLASHGWDVAALPAEVEAHSLQLAADDPLPHAHAEAPPGVEPGVAGTLQSGLHVPLIAEDEPVGLLLVHSRRTAAFEPGEIALLQTFANQAALALQRAGLIAQLRDKIERLQAAQAELAQKERMERELELARQVQQQMLPRTLPRIPRYRLAARYAPARQVGGDFYDVIELDEDHFGVAIADVSDKGMPAALYMALTRSLLRAEAQRTPSPRLVLAHVNQLLLQLAEPNMFVTLFYGVISRRSRRLTYCRAGHDRPYILHRGESRQLQGKGMALGLLPAKEMKLEEREVELAPGDRLVLYSDGLSDALSPEGEIFGLTRLQALLAQAAGLPVEEMAEAVFSQLSRFQGGAAQYDDMTLVIVAVDQ